MSWQTPPCLSCWRTDLVIRTTEKLDQQHSLAALMSATGTSATSRGDLRMSACRAQTGPAAEIGRRTESDPERSLAASKSRSAAVFCRARWAIVGQTVGACLRSPMFDWKRRDFIALLGGAAAWPLAARAQQNGRLRRVGVLMGLAESDPEGQARVAAFRQGLEQLGWAEGRNVRIDLRWAAGEVNRARTHAAELVA